MARRWALGGMAAALALAMAAAWWLTSGVSADKTAATAEPAPASPGRLTADQVRQMGITLAAAEPATSLQLGTVPGTVTLPPEARVAVTAPFGGSVVRLHVVNGQAVVRGQPLAVIRSVEPVQYGAALARARAQLAVAEANAARTGQLVREGIVAAARADETQAALREAQVAVAENRRILAQTGASATGETVLRAPIGGRVAAVNVQTGGPVDGLTAPFVIENTASLMVDLQIPERLVNEVYPGIGIELPGSGSQPVRGTIISVGSTIDPATRAVIARARVGSDPVLVSGKPVMAALLGERRLAGGVSVPAAAVTRMGERDVVFVRGRDGFAVRQVEIAGRSADRIILRGGLNPGEQVATSGLAELKVVLDGG